MSDNRKTSRDIRSGDGQSRVERLRESAKSWAERPGRPAEKQASPVWRRQTFTLPREEARAKAREFLNRYPREAYWSEVESWRVLEDERIEFTMRRLPTAD